MRGLVLSRRAERDLRRIGAGVDLARLRRALEALAGGATNLDAKPLAGSAPWCRLRVGDYRILYRAVDSGEAADADARWLVARVVHRRDLERAVSTLA
ncbi:MAG TPA: type II toxin-antitoxin system RelE/ParE family toxin [Candidatus Limnocylindria bacterium]|nr:type II toxin-antitoxin system RelE/ParE family toxin [Candidatus Limnocylindria bacterium]